MHRFVVGMVEKLHAAQLIGQVLYHGFVDMFQEAIKLRVALGALH